MPIGQPECQACGGDMKKGRKSQSSGMGCIVLILGIVLAPFLIGIPIIIYALHLMTKMQGLWICRQCGFEINRIRRWYEIT